MTIALLSNILTIILCGAVLVQCARMTRSIAQFRQVDLPAMIGALDGATGRADTVLGQLRDLLQREAEPKMRQLSEGHAVAEELGVMIGIANATADRLLDTARDLRASEDRDLAA